MPRIGLDLTDDLLARLDRQALLMGQSRQSLITTAVTHLVRDFEAIDTESGIGCPECQGPTEVDVVQGESRRVCVRCPWNIPEPLPGISTSKVPRV